MSKLFTGLPMMVILMFLFYVVFRFLAVPSLLIAVITLSSVFANRLCSIIANGMEQLDPEQMEAAVSLGFPPAAAFRYAVLPQLLITVRGHYIAETESLIRQSAIVGYIAIVDLTKAANIILARTYDSLFPLILVSVIYYLIILAVSAVIERIAVRSAQYRGHRLPPESRTMESMDDVIRRFE